MVAFTSMLTFALTIAHGKLCTQLNLDFSMILFDMGNEEMGLLLQKVDFHPSMVFFSPQIHRCWLLACVSPFSPATTMPKTGSFIKKRNVFVTILEAGKSNVNVPALGKDLFTASQRCGRHHWLSNERRCELNSPFHLL